MPKTGRVYLAMYTHPQPVKGRTEFLFEMGPRPQFDPTREGLAPLTLTAVKKLPKPFENALKEAVNEPMKLGKIRFAVEGGTAVATYYHPKDFLSPGDLRKRTNGLPYFMEAMALSHLRRTTSFLTRMSTSNEPSQPRRKQLLRIGITPFEPIPIRKWMEGLGQGIRWRMKNR